MPSYRANLKAARLAREWGFRGKIGATATEVLEDDAEWRAALTALNIGDHSALADLRSGTILTVAEELGSDTSFDPATGDWWINLESGLLGDGVYVSALDFETSNDDTQLTVLDDVGAVVFGPAGEGIPNLGANLTDDEWIHIDGSYESIIENIMLDVMFDLPSREDIKECVITKETVTENAQPKLILEDGSEYKADNNEKTSA